MGQIVNLFKSLSLKQKLSIGVALVAIIAALYGITDWRREKDFKPLYSGLSPEDASAIVQKVKEAGSDYRLSDTGGVISVPAAKVAELRLEMASAGLPKSGHVGFELFDKANFGATDFVEHINYNRALEGELERSVESLSAVESARVHITPPKESVFVESREPGKASVIVHLRAGASLSPQNVLAVQQLVGSAVEGVTPDTVSVVDARGTLLSRRKSAQEDTQDAIYSYRERMEHDLLEKVNTTLEPLLGRDRFRAGVSVDCDLSTSDQSEETFDPGKSVMLTSQKTEEVTTSNATLGIPGTASSLPRPAARAGGPTTTSNKRSENITFESSHVQRKIHTPEGQVRRLSVSVLLDQDAHWQGKGNAMKLVAVPPSPETLKAVHDVVAGVTGFSQERGDIITVESLPFAATLQQPPPGEPGMPDASGKGNKLTPIQQLLSNKPLLIGAGIGALVFLLAGAAGVFFFMKRRGKHAADVTDTSAPALPAGEEKRNSTLDLANAAEKMEAALAERVAEQERADIAALAALKLPTVTTKKSELLTKEIREGTKRDSSVSAQVLQTWIHDD